MRGRAAMIARGWKISDFAAVVAVVGTLALVGVWDNEQTIRRNLDAGYDTSAMVTGANERNNRFPLVFDGLRPRFVDETYSLDLTWRGRDGIERARQKVPVSGEFMASLMVGDKVRLVPVTIKVVDEQGAVPTIAPDATARLDHLTGIATWAGYGTAVAALIFVVNVGGRWRQRNRGAATARYGLEPTAWHIPPRLAMLTVVCLGFAGIVGYNSLKDKAIREHGRDATATITGLHASLGSDHTISYSIDFAWRDGSGAERHFGPIHISDAYAQRIAANGALITRQTTIRYLEEDRSARPIILADANARRKHGVVGPVMMAVFGIAGVALAAVTAWRTKRA